MHYYKSLKYNSTYESGFQIRLTFCDNKEPNCIDLRDETN